MTIWLLADTHFGHTAMEILCDRPVGFEERILKNARRLIGINDVLLHLGDFCIGHDAEWHRMFMEALPETSRKWLVKGNHDRQSFGWYMAHGWDLVADEIRLTIFGKNIIFSHKPRMVRYFGEFDLNIHGHHHNTRHHPEDMTTCSHILIFPEHEYRPVNLRKIVETFNG